MPEIGKMVIREAADRHALWLDDGHYGFTIEVTIAAHAAAGRSCGGDALREFRVPDGMRRNRIDRKHGAGKPAAGTESLRSQGLAPLTLDDFAQPFEPGYLKHFAGQMTIDRSSCRVCLHSVLEHRSRGP